MKKVPYLLLNLVILCCFTTTLNAQHNPEFEEKMLELVNELRSQYGAAPVILNTSLNTAAKDHSVDMATNNYFSHTGLNGSNFSQRIQNAGYQGSPMSENIAAGSNTAEGTFNQWVNSTDHFNNMINPNANEMGIGYGFDSQAQYRHYWTQVFGYGNTLSIDEFPTKKEEIVLYPNPTKGNLNISLQQTDEQYVSFTIYDINGKVIHNDHLKKNQDNFKISFQHLPNGMYYLQINKLPVQKIVKI